MASTAGHDREARMAAELAARASYGRLVALLARQWRDLAAAEDALADAFRAALEHWPTSGVPARPEAWLLTTARRVLIDRARAQTVRADAGPTLALLTDQFAMAEPALFPDDRLKLLFVCAHPAIDASARTPLMLQTVLGLDAARIAAAFLTSAAALGQRLVRAKAKIRDAGIAFAVPEQSELAPRLDAVLQAVYVAYGSGWEDVAGADPKRRGLAEEAIWLGRLIAGLLPREPEAHGLLALMLHCEARRAARRDAAGAFVPLAEQDVALWSRAMIGQAETALGEAAKLGRIGPFQLEAAIQSVHAARAVSGRTDWQALAQLHEGLARLAPTTGVLVSRAAAFAEAFGPERGLALLTELPEAEIASYQPFWALRAHLMQRLGLEAEARLAFDRAIGLADDPAVRAFLARRRDASVG
ncbi:MAG: RNA polymerase subunit sigma-70 [Beijerinckiaceae bacterium]|nr:RNA polymerase subunit sigma-70 [Beijerinckiaceae bacterium]